MRNMAKTSSQLCSGVKKSPAVKDGHERHLADYKEPTLKNITFLLGVMRVSLVGSPQSAPKLAILWGFV